MNIRMLQAALGGLVLFVWHIPTFAQDARWAERMFSELNHDFGAVARGADVKYRLKITNNIQQTVHIADVTTSCGCTAARPEKETLGRGESTNVEITMNTVKFEGHKSSSVTVIFDRPAHAEVRIPIESYIRRDVVLTPGGAQFGSVAKGTSLNRTIGIAYAGRNDWKIRDVICRNPHVQAQVVETQRAAGIVKYDLRIALKDSAPLGPFRDQVILITNDPGSSSIPVLLDGLVEADYSVSPEVVSFGTLAPGERKTVNVVVRGKRPFKIEKIESQTSSGLFEIQMPKDVKPVQILPLTLIAPAEPGTVNEEFFVTISERSEPLRFKSHGRVAAQSRVSTAGSSNAGVTP
ncbi:MAG TPA: DUF1573 domain-containing protein [Planctomycetaceae bacterium]